MRHTGTTSVLPSVKISTVVSVDRSRQSIHCPVTICGNQTVVTSALINTGAGGAFIDTTFAKKHGIALKKLISPISVYNVDHTPNKEGMITQYTWVDLNIGGVVIPTRLHATSLGGESLIFGLPWIDRIDPVIKFREGTIQINKERIRKEHSRFLELKAAKILSLEKDVAHPTVEKTHDVMDKVVDFFMPTDSEDDYDRSLPEPPDVAEEELVISYVRGEPVFRILSSEVLESILVM